MYLKKGTYLLAHIWCFAGKCKLQTFHHLSRIAMATSNKEKAIEAILDIYRASSSKTVQVLAALGQVGGPLAVTEIMRIYRSHSSRTRQVIEALGNAGGARAITELKRIHRTHASQKDAIIAALGKAGRK